MQSTAFPVPREIVPKPPKAYNILGIRDEVAAAFATAHRTLLRSMDEGPMIRRLKTARRTDRKSALYQRRMWEKVHGRKLGAKPRPEPANEASSPTTSSQNSPKSQAQQDLARWAYRRALIEAGFMVDRTSPHPGQPPASPESASSRSKSAQPHSDQAA